MRQPSASAARAARSTAERFNTGSAPGKPRHTGHTFVFGGAPKAVLQPQKIFERVSSWAWISRPMTGSNIDSELVRWRVGDSRATDHGVGPAARTSDDTAAANALKLSANMRASFAAC